MIYLSGPITPRHGRTIEQHVDAAREVFLRFVRAGVPMYCPHLEAAHPDVQAVPYEDWIRYDLAVIDRCDCLLRLPNWEESSGAVREVEYALQRRLPIFDVEADALAFVAGLLSFRASPGG